MNTLEAMQELIRRDGSSRRAISARMGRSSNFLTATESQARTRGGDALAGTLATLARATGHRLALVPVDELTPRAIVIDGPEDQSQDAGD